ncbi:MAG: hypothetical protein NT007_14305 [Candidatus Kapabacteria bacterium]|nr:hypothetical protein [Candidatus Kapabacteria bacterium]
MKFINVFCFVFIICFSSALADKRNMVWTYQYSILNPGEAELEQYSTFSSSEKAKFGSATNAELNLELEFGMSKFMDFAVYQVFTQSHTGGFSYDGLKLRWRFRLAEQDSFWVNPIFYIEYEADPTFQKSAFEPKFIFQKDFGKFSISLNPYMEIEKKGAEKWDAEFKYAAGAFYRFTKLMSLGLELAGDPGANYIGPTISHGTDKMWVSFGSQFGIGKIAIEDPKFRLRMIIGVNL